MAFCGEGLTVTGDFSFTVTWNVKFNITASKISKTAFIEQFPLSGDWSFELEKKEGADELRLRLYAGGVPPSTFHQQNAVTRFALFSLIPSQTPLLGGESSYRGPLYERSLAKHIWKIPRSTWEGAGQASAGKYDPATLRQYRIELTIASAGRGGSPETLARRLTGLNLQQLPHDVRLFFPKAREGGAELWVKSDILAASSKYLKDLLASDFAESIPRRSKRSRADGQVAVKVEAGGEEEHFDDSDDETDEFLFSSRPPTLEQPSEADDVPYRQITITQTAYSTYHAILVYLHTGFIHFAPLRSSTAEPDSRLSVLSAAYEEHPSLPLPISSKSAYRLAHLLQLPELQDQCLGAYRSSLTVKNAAAELFSDASLAYDDLRAVVNKFVKDKWKQVKASEGWKDFQQKIRAREVKEPEASLAILMEVLEAVA
ncbi:hypothetical protein JCM8097_008494 [Rhodosporidiobolus ruineniae]